jgi:hypothetical protein
MQSVINFVKTNFYLIVLVMGLVLLAWNVFLQLRLEKTRKRIKIFFQGRKTKDLEEVIAEQLKRTKNIEGDVKKLFKWNEDLQKIADISIQKVGVVRFNPFKDTGGDQSFAIALLDKNNNGLVISSLYSREGTRVYTKPVENGDSSYHLSEEEKQAIQKAIL